MGRRLAPARPPRAPIPSEPCPAEGESGPGRQVCRLMRQHGAVAAKGLEIRALARDEQVRSGQVRLVPSVASNAPERQPFVPLQTDARSYRFCAHHLHPSCAMAPHVLSDRCRSDCARHPGGALALREGAPGRAPPEQSLANLTGFAKTRNRSIARPPVRPGNRPGVVR